WAVLRAWSARWPTTMSLSRVPLGRLTSWPTSGLAGVSGLAPGCGSSGTATTPCLPRCPPDLFRQQEHVPPGSDLHGDHLSLAVPVTPGRNLAPSAGGPCHPGLTSASRVPRDANSPCAGESPASRPCLGAGTRERLEVPGCA